ncbi:hypothetical protein [Leptolyngbya ohadii]|uniref:hypothetical protein n=1 Tax=Leptolyngbya ohadii TaxID=1962290 RepID=UPI000B59E46A|nr:hypothetical protein [Leptolyngbya ohadii]
MKSFPFKIGYKKIFLFGFAAVAIAGCRPELPFFGSTDDPATDPAADQATAPVDAAGNPAPAAAPAPGQTSPDAAQSVRCDTPNYFADIAIENGQPVMTFVQKPETASLTKAPAKRTDNPDGSITFAAGGEATFYSRFFPNQSCFLQTVASNGAVGFEENGQIRR